MSQLRKLSLVILIIFFLSMAPSTIFKSEANVGAPVQAVIFQVTERLDNETLVFKVHSTFSTELKTLSRENFILNTLNGKMFQDTFENLAITLQQLGIDQMTSDVNGNVTIFLSYGSINVNVTYNSASPSFQQLHAVISEIIDRYSGKTWNYPKLWPLDIAVTVLESFPEQYSVQAIIQRGLDPLTYVMSVTVNLIVFPTNNPTSILHQDLTSSEITSGGKSTIVSFSTFSVGESYRPNDLKFKITVNSKTSLIYDLSNGQIQSSTDRIDSAPTSATTTAFQPPVLLLLGMGVMAFQLRQKKRKK